ncbi:MAG: class I SAM-dependent methyltransferase [Saprospiraceae bacterium]|nr:class I SAM-dependent methyltransferase [Saprospiraceae bacterium]
MSLRKTYYRLPIWLRYIARRVVFFPLDLKDKLSGNRDELAPPRGLIFTGPGDFRKEGKLLLDQFIAFAKLKPGENVLDIGSGIGRAAVPLTGYLNSSAEYLGFDPVEKGIRWCRKAIHARFPNFSFVHIPLQNDLYQANGDAASTFVFPFQEGHWDLVMANSVFTHMVPEEIDQYLGEACRMLSPGGRIFASFFILYDQRNISNSSYQFPFHREGYALMDEKVESANVAIEENFLVSLLEKNHLRIVRKELGFWNTGIRGEKLNFQDVLILEKDWS